MRCTLSVCVSVSLTVYKRSQFHFSPSIFSYGFSFGNNRLFPYQLGCFRKKLQASACVTLKQALEVSYAIGIRLLSQTGLKQFNVFNVIFLEVKKHADFKTE